MNKHIEMIIDYLVDGEDFRYNDNHGTLIRCKDCKHWNKLMFMCSKNSGEWKPDDYCSFGERKDGDQNVEIH